MDALSAVLGIVLIDLVLSGDNAIVIGLAAHRLPAQQRRFAILFGGGAAIVLRIALTAAAALLLTIPGLQAIGGLLLLWIAFKLLKDEDKNARIHCAPGTLRGAILTILVADVVMSLDNVLGVAAASDGDLPLLLFGLGLSVAILMLGGSLVAELVNRLQWLGYLGAGVIAWTGIDMFLEDPVIGGTAIVPPDAQLLTTAAVTLAVIAISHAVHRQRREAGSS